MIHVGELEEWKCDVGRSKQIQPYIKNLFFGYAIAGCPRIYDWRSELNKFSINEINETKTLKREGCPGNSS